MTQITFESSDVGVIIRATITFVDFDPTGAACDLVYTSLGGRVQRRAMTFNDVSVATYSIAEGDFDPGYYTAVVQARKGGVEVSSEQFQIQVL